MTKPPSSAGGDGIGLSVSSDQHDDDTDKINLTPLADDKQGENFGTMTAGITPSFIPSSVCYSPIPYREEDDGNGNTSNARSTEEQPHVISSIMREQSRLEKGSVQIVQKSDQAQVTALEDRVRDLEEKLSTLSVLLLQQNQRQLPRNNNNNNNNNRKQSCSLSPESSGYDDSSISPPSTPFQSLSSFATIPSSNVPVLESPAPVSRRYRNARSGFNNSDNFSDCSLPYEQRNPRNQNCNNGSNSPPKISRGLRNNLSYHILHAPDSELDLRSTCDDGGSSRSDAGSENDILHNTKSVGTNNGGLRAAIQNDDNFDNGFPSLDSLPGSSRTSPILSPDPIVASVLSPDILKDAIGADSSPSTIKVAPPFLSKISGSKERDVPSGRDASAKADMSASNSAISDSSASKHQKKKSNIKSKWLDYLNSVQESNYDTDKQMEEFVKVPSAVEALLNFGFWISVDSFLYTLTMLPLRFVYSSFLLTVLVFRKIAGRSASGSFQFHRHNIYHLIQVTIIYIIYAYVLMPINISIMYHWIRVQSMVKLYLLVAMIEVFDRLLCSLGQDCLDSLYWNTTRRPRSSRLIVSALVVLVYTALHSFLLFVHVATLNVAMNSDDQALLSLLIGGNFAEIKSTVFKKYNKATLFKIAASDICERFKLALFLFLVLMLNASQGMDKNMLYNYLSMCGIVWCAEWLSDWLKHSFITKFNYIASGVYSEYSLLLAGDVSGFGHEGENLDKSHAVVKRLGLAQIPLVCVMTKYLKEAYKYQTYENQPQTWLLVVGAVSIWLLLLATKLSLASFLERMSRNKLEAAPEFSKNNATVAKKKN